MNPQAGAEGQTPVDTAEGRGCEISLTSDLEVIRRC